MANTSLSRYLWIWTELIHPTSQCTKRLATNSVVKEEQIEGTVLEAKPILQSSVDTDSSIDKPKASGKWNVTMNGRQNSPDDDDCTREPKRQKESNFGLHNLVKEFSLLNRFGFRMGQNYLSVSNFWKLNMNESYARYSLPVRSIWVKIQPTNVHFASFLRSLRYYTVASFIWLLNKYNNFKILLRQ